MVDSMIELLFGLSWSALILLIISFIVGSVVAALRAVSHESDHQREQVKEIFAFRDKVTVSDVIETGVIVMTNPEDHDRL